MNERRKEVLQHFVILNKNFEIRKEKTTWLDGATTDGELEPIPRLILLEQVILPITLPLTKDVEFAMKRGILQGNVRIRKKRNLVASSAARKAITRQIAPMLEKTVVRKKVASNVEKKATWPETVSNLTNVANVEKKATSQTIA